jgi:hypothetical protein
VTPDLYIPHLGNEGFAGCTLIQTDIGAMRVDELSHLHPESIATIWDGMKCYRKIERYKRLKNRMCVSFATLTSRVVCTLELPVLVKHEDGSAVWKPAGSMQIDDKVLVAASDYLSASWQPVVDVGIEEVQPVWNLTIVQTHCCWADRILCHH